MLRRQKQKGFTLIELLVVISIIALLIGILLPALGAARRNANKMKNSTQLRSIIQAMLTFASGNKDVLPGRSKRAGEILAADIDFSDQDGHAVEARYAILLASGSISGEILLSPGDSKDEKWDGTDDLAAENYSYSLLEIELGGGRRKVWTGGNATSSTPLMSDPLTDGTVGTTTGYKSYWSASAEEWVGSVGFGDGHAGFEDAALIPDTRFSAALCDGSGNLGDDLFEDETDTGCDAYNNALLHFEGTTGVKP